MESNGTPVDVNEAPSNGRNGWDGWGRAACFKFYPFSSCPK